MKKINKFFALILAVVIFAVQPINALAVSYSSSPFKSYRYTHQAQFDGMTLLHGIDLSNHNDSADFDKLKKAGISFAFLRIGYRGYGIKGTLMNDTKFDTFYNDAKKAGLSVGAYFYSQALNEAEAIEEADKAISLLKGRALDLPIVFDYEFANVRDGRLDSAWSSGRINKEKMTKNAIAFCERVKEKGYQPMVYASKYFFYDNLDYKALEQKGYGIWLAHYATGTDYKGKFNAWQYSETGAISGVSGNVDCNFMYVNPNDYVIDLDAPTLTVTANGVNSVSLKFNAVENADGYEIFRKSNDNYTSLAQTTDTKVTVTGLTPAFTYTLCAVSYRYIDGMKYYGNYGKTVKATTKPDKVSGFTASTTDTTASIKWKKVGYPTGYRVYVFRNASNSYELYSTVTTNSVKITGLLPNKTYAIRVEALKGDFVGKRSDKLNVRTKPKAPTVKSVTSPSTKRIKITWNKNTSNTGYQIQWSTTSNFSSNVKTQTFKGSSLYSKTIQTYRAKSYYSIRVRSYVTVGGKNYYSPWSKSTRLKVK